MGAQSLPAWSPHSKVLQRLVAGDSVGLGGRESLSEEVMSRQRGWGAVRACKGPCAGERDLITEMSALAEG